MLKILSNRRKKVDLIMELVSRMAWNLGGWIIGSFVWSNDPTNEPSCFNPMFLQWLGIGLLRSGSTMK